MLRKVTKTFVHKVMYSFARNSTQLQNMENQLLKIASQTQEIPPGAYDKLMVLPVSLPIFPFNTLVTQVHPFVWQYMEQQKIKHLGAFLLKDQSEPLLLQPEDFKSIYLASKPTEVNSEIEELETLADQFHQNIVYEKSIIQTRRGQSPDIKVITSINEIYPTGTICKASFQKLSEHGAEQIFLILKGIQRIQLIPKESSQNKFILHSKAVPIRDHAQQYANDAKYKVLLSKLLQIYAQIRQKIPINVPELLNNPAHPSTVDVLCGYLCLTTFFHRADLIKLFLTLPIHDRLKLCLEYFEKYSESLQQQWKSLENKTNLPASPQVQKKHMKEIYDFLKKQFASPESAPFVEKIQKQLTGRTLPINIQKLINDELAAISELSESHPDFNLKRNFIELLVSLPFGILSEDSFQIKQAEEILSNSHYGMDEIKTRILEFLSVSKLKGSPTGKALLLVGPPGVGKTSIASTIAKCLNRKFVRVSLGGENDVAIIKGHRRTYMASYPGKIVQALKQAQVENPVILLDEIDKLGRSFRGSISDALLEVLDQSQNKSFVDNYLEVPVDLSKVLFICSANLADTISGPLYDRMEVINLSGYTNEDKVKIAQKHLVPNIIEETGLKPYYNKSLSEELLYYIINHYCRESGVRSLQRTLQRLFEKLVIRVVKFQQNNKSELDLDVQIKDLENLIGLPQFGESTKRINIPGLGVGLAYNSYGGSLMYIEIVKMSYFDQKETKKNDEEVVIVDAPKGGSGQLRITGQLGQTIKESCEIAYTHAKKILATKLNNNYLENNKLHMHFPAGAVKKDGPSAGIAITTALISMALGKPLKEKTAMTGEISLTGKVLRIGGLKEKVLAAKREGIENIIIPHGNKSDWEELPEGLKNGITFYFVEEYKEVMKVAFDIEI